MKRYLIFTKTMACLLGISLTALKSSAKTGSPATTARLNKQQQASPMLFTENRGQVADVNGTPRPDILFTAHNKGARVFLTSTGIQYQFTHIIYPEGYEQDPRQVKDAEKQAKLEEQITTQTYRFSMTLAGANLHPVVRKEGKNEYTENFFLPQCPNGITGVNTYQKVVYENVYPSIDWVVYSNGSGMKYDFIVRPGGDPNQIKLSITDAKGVQVTKAGELLMQTQLGEVREHAPVSYANGKSIATHFKKEQDGSIGFAVASAPAGATLTIDPSISWATYYGGTGNELENALNGNCMGTDGSNVYLSGSTTSTSGIASGGFQTTTGGSTDGFLAKYNSSGAIVWSTYYGGTGTDMFVGCAADPSGNVYAVGTTGVSTGLATTYQLTNGGSNDVMLVKFDGTTGGRIWSLYYGGTGLEAASNVTTDPSGNVIITGNTGSTNAIATAGAHTTAFVGATDAFVAKFSSAGAIVWGTYYGGTLSEQARGIATDATGNIYVSGITSSTSGMSTAGTYQPTHVGSSNAYLGKFTPGGVLAWGTYFGSGTESGSNCITDGSGNVLLVGETTASSGIATAGTAQTTIGGGTDMFVEEFDAATGSTRNWGTYYGGPVTDFCNGVAIDASGNLLLSGYTASTSGIASGGFQNTFGGGSADAILVKLNPSGGLVWGSYFGGESSDQAAGVVVTPNKIYISGQTSSLTNIATPGAAQTTNAGGTDVYLLQVSDISLITDTISPASYCAGATVHVPFTAAGTFTSGNIFTAQLSDATGSFTGSGVTSIGTLTATASDTITATIPAAAINGTAYRIRVISSSPVDTGTNNGVNLTVLSLPAVGAVTGTVSVCPGNTGSLSDTTTGGTWSSSATGVAVVSSTGIVTGVAAGTAIITYAVTNSCGTIDSTNTVTVNAAASASAITGTSTLCPLTTTTLSDATTGGTWSSSNTGVATVASTGIVTGVAAGTAVITYAITNTCGTADSIMTVTVNPLPSAGTITGVPTVCLGATTVLANTTTGGVWSSSNTAVATVSASGTVSGVTSGTAIITYKVTTTCGIADSVKTVTVSALSSAAPITGTPTVCLGTTTTLANSTTGGTWSSSNTGVATIGTSGIVSGIAAGTATITYAISNGCGTADSTITVTVNPLASAAPILGAPTVCLGGTTALSDATTGGTWSSSTTSVATIDGTGTVHGVTSGTAIITYAVTTSCGTADSFFTITVNLLPSAGAITGSSTVCTGATTTLSDVTTGGAWSSSNTAVATVTGTGIVSGIASGTAMITYEVTSSCGTIDSTFTITVNTLPTAGTISGSPTVCIGATTLLGDVPTGGAWSSSNTAVATVTGTGIVSGIAAGTSIITYEITNGCGTLDSTFTITVNPLPVAGFITGTSTVCALAATTLADATTGGTWSSSVPGVATVSSTGTVTGVTAGTATISYVVTNSCGSADTTILVTVNPLPTPGTITGTATTCILSTTTLGDITPDGVWSSADTAIATVGTSGTVSGVSAGTTTISYAVTNSCGTVAATAIVTINSLPAAPAAITGTASVCPGSSITLSDATTGGVWSSNDTAIATVTSTGDVLGVTAGTATISYVLTNSCGSVAAQQVVTVLSASSSACAGSGLAVNNTTGTIADLKLFPNPNDGSFIVNLSSAIDEPVHVMISNVVGQKVTDMTTVTNKNTNIQINPAAGVYFLSATTAHGKYTVKFTVE